MSETVFMIKCLKCKSEFNQGDTNRRFCMSCRYNKDTEQRRRAHLKRETKRQEAKIKPVFYIKYCPVCEMDFKTKIKHKKYCTKRCMERKKKFPLYVENIKNNIVNLEKRIVNINLKYEKKMNVLEEQLDYMNFQLEKQRVKYFTRLEHFEKVMNK